MQIILNEFVFTFDIKKWIAKAREGQGSISARLSHLSHCAEENEEKAAAGNIDVCHVQFFSNMLFAR